MTEKKDLKEDLAELKDIPREHEIVRTVAQGILLELHLALKYAKTEDESYLKLRDKIREDRKELMNKLEQEPTAESHCINKHLLYLFGAYQEIADKSPLEEKKRFLKKAYEYYRIFWSLRVVED